MKILAGAFAADDSSTSALMDFLRNGCAGPPSGPRAVTVSIGPGPRLTLPQATQCALADSVLDIRAGPDDLISLQIILPMN